MNGQGDTDDYPTVVLDGQKWEQLGEVWMGRGGRVYAGHPLHAALNEILRLQQDPGGPDD